MPPCQPAVPASAAPGWPMNQQEVVHMIGPHLEVLRDKHARLEQVINEEYARPHPDEARLHELKREKLRLKDAISSLNNGHMDA